ncbi:2-amino-4-hydroxy-6-hydroxymethyldihydropteridine diphosphokinase [Corynebacterium efficiens YS-314]|uniref:2-amino-4-hydroxy-6-hydroxymethyldihydropteridine diphosphokinase n=1 Tax=Corynebacterium efficiens (strain DSM 44549 / YS-314 / AJ 12310 / JCM 11189 / NBRC 100395) TaxID=196164 RepID=Q8FMG6_COREF|nr:2-amino-4-hydroxy-6-hydroxymethyldihydropteridine diphosphokinase [Corynebacterium efficiens]EEW51067.1 2-amino-4-hydroxy-6-hydroxymethyldihydropteridine diphosphokinase [Corynebacterium efficiens YS-314]BAC19348.1 putative 2-amino-4-hydroxy-6-hydroxymethyldihydropteridine pyrophosphokinase [Corynebacterium efficiens YS-314]
MRAVLSIGSNMDDRYALLQGVIDEFRDNLVAVSSIYATPPWGVEDQDEFLNAVLVVDVDGIPIELLRRCQKLENDADRVRTRKWGPRTLDVDIVQIRNGEQELLSDDPVLTLPHPWAWQRAFVLIPWLEVEPNAVLHGTAVAALVENLDPTDIEGVTKVREF